MADDAKLRGLLTAVLGGTDGVDEFFGGEALGLTFSDAPTVSLELNERGHLFAYSLLADIPEEAEAARDLVVRALELNLPGFLDYGCSFSVYDGMIAVFSACGYAAMAEKDFRDFLRKFAAQARELRVELTEFASSAGEAGEGTGGAARASVPAVAAQGWIIA